MALTKAEIEAVLEAKRKAEEAVERTRHLIEPETVRILREQHERMRDLVDPPALKALREHEEQMRHLIDPPAGRAFIQQQARMKNLVDPAMLALADQRNAFAAAFDSPAIREIIEQNETISRKMQDMVALIPKFEPIIPLELAKETLSRSMFGGEFVETMRRISAKHGISKSFGASVIEALGHIKDIEPYPDVGMLTDTFRDYDVSKYYRNFKYIEEMSRAAQSVLGTVQFDSLGDLIGVVDPAELQFGTIRLNKSYARLAVSAAAAPGSIIEAPFMAKVPALAVYSQARVMRSITTHSADEPVIAIWGEVQVETTEIIETTLPLVSPALLTSWKGGLATARRRGEDWVRQASASLRYVLITTLDTLAPKDTVIADGVDSKHLSRKGELMRTGQVHWLCRSLRNKTYRKMVLSDLESAIDIIDTMSEAVHREDYPEIEEAFGTMSVRAAVALRHLLEIFKTRN